MLIGAIAIVAIAAGMLLSRYMLGRAAQGAPILETATLLDPPRPLPPMQLTDDQGQPFDNARVRERWSLLFFGFTNCPDICPTTLTQLAQVEKALADLPAAQRPQIVLMSVDPQRDTAAQLDKYVHFFSPSFVGVTGTERAVEELTRQLGVPVAITRTSDTYTVDHSSAIFLVNPAGKMRALFSAPHVTKAIAEDYRRIVTAS